MVFQFSYYDLNSSVISFDRERSNEKILLIDDDQDDRIFFV